VVCWFPSGAAFYDAILELAFLLFARQAGSAAFGRDRPATS
jgi:hypothetical protein